MLSKHNKSYCILPFIHLHVNEKNDIKLCCLSGGKSIGKYSQEFDFVNNIELQKIRQSMLAGERVPQCETCYNYEDNGADSSRIFNNRQWFNRLSINDLEETTVKLIYYDIRNDNLCNLSCRMCNPQFSSQLAKEYKEIGWRYPVEPMSFGFNDVVDLSTVQQIYVAGGEPSLMPEFRKFLKRAIDAGRTDIGILMNTNATNLNKEYRILLSKFSNLNIVCSIDGYDFVNKYIRWPADWSTIIENVHGLTEITSGVSFNITVSIWNISNLSKLIFFLEKEFPNRSILLNDVMWPPHQKFEAFPDKSVALKDLELIKTSSHYINDPSFKSKLDFYINTISNTKLDLKILKDFFQFNDRLDRSRDVKLADYIPELEKCRELTTKQI